MIFTAPRAAICCLVSAISPAPPHGDLLDVFTELGPHLHDAIHEGARKVHLVRVDLIHQVLDLRDRDPAVIAQSG